jgi:hypothetical protein
MTANHTKLIGLGVGAILATAAPMYAQAKQPSADTLKAEARNFFKIISGDKRKSQTYCKIVELNDQIDEREDPIEAGKLTRKRDKLQEKRSQICRVCCWPYAHRQGFPRLSGDRFNIRAARQVV